MTTGWLNLVWRCAFTAAALLLAIALIRLGIADVWLLGTSVPSSASSRFQARSEVALAELESAHSLDPQNPRILELLGDIHYRRARLAADDLAGKLGHLEKARDRYAAAVASRPNQGERWADMIYVYSDLIEVRQKLAATPQEAASHFAHDLRGLKQALEHAAQLAPWRSPVLSALEYAAKQHDGLLGPDERRIIAAAQERMAEKKRQIK